MNFFIQQSIKGLLAIVFVGVSMSTVYAQGWKKDIQKLPQTLGKKPPSTGRGPVAHPNVPHVSPTSPGASGAASGVAPTLLSHVATTGLERQAAQILTQAQTAAQSTLANLQKDFLTGQQALQKIRPGWKSELMLSGFTRQQLDLVEQAFKETDLFLFETDETGNWLKPRSAEWKYEAWYSKILTDNTWGEMALNEGQIKMLFGKSSRLDDVFTRLNLQAFWLVNKRFPKPGAPGEEGKLARHAKYNLDKRDGRKINPEVEGYVYGNMFAKLKTLKPSYGPKDRAFRRTPEEVWKDLIQFMREHHGQLPRQSSADDYERKLRYAWNNIYQKKQGSNDMYVRRLIDLHAAKVQKTTTHKAAREWLGIIEPWVLEHQRWPSAYLEKEKAMYMGGDAAMRRNPEDSASIRLKRLKEKYGMNNAPSRTSQAWLDIIEPWVLEHQRWPSQTIEEEKAMYAGAGAAMRRNPTHPASVRLRKLKETYFKPRGNTPQAWLEIIEPWVIEHQCWPSSKSIEEEKVMYAGAEAAMRNNPEDPASIQLKRLKNMYFKSRKNTPQAWLEIIEPWVLDHQRWPSQAIEEEKIMYRGADGVIRHHPEDPVGIRLKELKEKYQ